jgi:aldehyde dehydrogenase (NAD+)
VDETASLDLAVRAIVFGAVGTAGQRCTTTRRVIVQESRYAELVERLVEAYGRCASAILSIPLPSWGR